MIVSNEFIEFLASWEGERLRAYKPIPSDPWTIGVGHTGSVFGEPIHSGMTITREQSRILLKGDLSRFERAVKREVPWRWRSRRRRFEAFVSMAFNLGEEILTPEPPLQSVGLVLRKRVTRGTIAEMGTAMMKFVYAGNDRLEGLVRRRRAEVHLLKTGEYQLNR